MKTPPHPSYRLVMQHQRTFSHGKILGLVMTQVVGTVPRQALSGCIPPLMLDPEPYDGDLCNIRYPQEE